MRRCPACYLLSGLRGGRLFLLRGGAFRQFFGEHRLENGEKGAAFDPHLGVDCGLMADLPFFFGKIDGLRLFFQFVALIFEAHFLFFALLRFEPKDLLPFFGAELEKGVQRFVKGTGVGGEVAEI